MKVISKTSTHRDITLETSVYELKELYDASLSRRKTVRHKEALAKFAHAIRAADKELNQLIEAEAAEPVTEVREQSELHNV